MKACSDRTKKGVVDCLRVVRLPSLDDGGVEKYLPGNVVARDESVRSAPVGDATREQASLHVVVGGGGGSARRRRRSD